MEKDFWVTEVLRGVVGQASQEDITVIFKGGTSRSKAYRLIKCFSEDVDMLVVLPTRGSDVMARDVCTYSLAARLAASPLACQRLCRQACLRRKPAPALRPTRIWRSGGRPT